MAEEAVLTEAGEGVLLITLNRPDARNAVNAALAAGVAAALDRLDAEDDLRVGILCGAGKGFSAGESPYVEGRGFAGIAQRAARKPLIAAIEGFAVAGGLEVALACDLIVAARDARLGIPEAKRSLVAPGGALGAARELAAAIAANGPLALEASKRILVEAPGWPEDELWQRQGEISGPVFGSEDAREGA